MNKVNILRVSEVFLESAEVAAEMASRPLNSPQVGTALIIGRLVLWAEKAGLFNMDISRETDYSIDLRFGAVGISQEYAQFRITWD